MSENKNIKAIMSLCGGSTARSHSSNVQMATFFRNKTLLGCIEVLTKIHGRKCSLSICDSKFKDEWFASFRIKMGQVPQNPQYNISL